MKFLFLFTFGVFFYSETVFAQYENLRLPQTELEKQILKRYCVTTVSKKQVSGDKERILYTKKIDINGNLIEKRMSNQTHYFKYDLKNRVILFVDSVTTPEERTHFPYDFEYDNKTGYLSFFRGFSPSSFFYKPEQNLLLEMQMAENMGYIRRYYFLNNDKQIERVFHTTPYYDTTKVIYCKYQNKKLIQEIELNISNNVIKDSLVNSYQYDAKGNVIYTLNKSYYFKVVEGKKVVETDSVAYQYGYDKLNRKVKEQYFYFQDPDYNYTYQFIYHQKYPNLLVAELYKDKQTTSKNIYTYTTKDGDKITFLDKPKTVPTKKTTIKK